VAKKSGLAQGFYLGGYDLSGDVGAINGASSPRTTTEIQGINKSAKERLLLLTDGLLEFLVFFNDAALAEHVILKTLPTTDVIALWVAGQAVGDVAAGIVAKQVDYAWERPADGSLAGTVQLMAQGTPLEWLTMLSAGEDTDASAESNASRDDAAQTTAGLIAYLQVVDIASGTPTVVIEDSANDSTWATLVSFAAVADGAEPTAERVTVTGTVDRYLRVTTTGTFTDFDYVVATRRGTAQDDLDLS
jgi:hypothetical protein